MANITLNLLANDKASPVMKKLGDSAKRIGVGLATAGAVAGAAAIAFGVDSVKAYAESEAAQSKLADAFARFPKLADTNLTSLQKLNTELAKKTRFDDDATAAAQATLAQYELTGEQIAALTPLVQDYAAKTGKDLSVAAEDLGKAVYGQGRALKDVGIDFTDTGTAAGNFDLIMQGLNEKVGGFAEVEGETAAGKLEILKTRFGEVQEKIGGALMPALDGIVTWLNGDGMTTIEGLSVWIAEEAIPGFQGLTDWIVKWKDELLILGGAITAAIALQTALNIVTAANPWGAVIAALVGVVAWTGYVITNIDTMSRGMLDAADTVLLGMVGMARGFNGLVEGLVNGLIDAINDFLNDVLNPMLGALGMGPLRIGGWTMDNSGLDDLAARLRRNLADSAVGSSNNSGDPTRRQSSTLRGGSVPSGAYNGRAMPRFAEGGAVMAATIALIGEGSEPEAVVPFSKVPQLVREAGYGGEGGGGPAVHVHIAGITTRTQGEVGREVVKAIETAEREGKLSRRWREGG